MFFRPLLLALSLPALCAGAASGDDERGIYPPNNRHVQRLRTYNREMYKVEQCAGYRPRTNCTSVLQRYPPTEEGRRYKVCFAKCTLAAVCDDRECAACAAAAFEYRQFPTRDGFSAWCRPVPCAQKGLVRWTDYTCSRERRCSLLHCKLGVRRVKPRKLQPFSLQLLASRAGAPAPQSAAGEPEGEDEAAAAAEDAAEDAHAAGGLGTVELGYEVQLGAARVGLPIRFRVNVTVPVVPEDIYLLVDATGSLGDAISALQRSVSALIAARQAAVPGAAFGLGFFRDEASRAGPGEALSHGFAHAQALTLDGGAVQRAADGLLARGGGDTPEAGLGALHALSTGGTAGWRAGARKVVALFGDAPQHEPVCVGGARLTRADVIRALRARDIAVVAVPVGAPGLDAETAPFGCKGIGARQRGGQMSAITSATGGLLTRPVAQHAVVDAIAAAVAALDIRFEVDVSDCGPEYAVELTGLVPDFVRYGDQLDLAVAVTTTSAACASSRPKKCVIRYIVGGVTISLQDVSLDEVLGCGGGRRD